MSIHNDSANLNEGVHTFADKQAMDAEIWESFPWDLFESEVYSQIIPTIDPTSDLIAHSIDAGQDHIQYFHAVKYETDLLPTRLTDLQEPLYETDPFPVSKIDSFYQTGSYQEIQQGPPPPLPLGYGLNPLRKDSDFSESVEYPPLPHDDTTTLDPAAAARSTRETLMPFAHPDWPLDVETVEDMLDQTREYAENNRSDKELSGNGKFPIRVQPARTAKSKPPPSTVLSPVAIYRPTVRRKKVTPNVSTFIRRLPDRNVKVAHTASSLPSRNYASDLTNRSQTLRCRQPPIALALIEPLDDEEPITKPSFIPYIPRRLKPFSRMG
ncbi:hypothetical protein V866_005407 [Kwoniella sp. B9012]